MPKAIHGFTNSCPQGQFIAAEGGERTINMPIIRTEGLTHIYSKGTPFQKVAIDHINIDIARGEFVGLIGHTGSGKSTFIQHLNGLLAPTGGKVIVDGVDIASSKLAARDVRFKVGLVFQYPEYQDRKSTRLNSSHD